MKTKVAPEAIRDAIQLCISDWHDAHNRGIFWWVDDMLCTNLLKYPTITFEEGDHITYVIHVSWVREWNRTGRTEEMSRFLEDWNSIENINGAFDEFYARGYNNIVLSTPDRIFKQGLLVSQYDFNEEWIDDLRAKGVTTEKICNGATCEYRLVKEGVLEQRLNDGGNTNEKE